MAQNGYLPRISDHLLQEHLEAMGAVLIEGAKWCGKTSTARQKACSVLMLQDPDQQESFKISIEVKPSLLLRGDTPRLLDEWQMYPVLWDAVRFAVDQREAVGQFILTGSAVPMDGAVMHTGTGRISRMLMRPMSLFESGDSNGDVSLKALFEGKTDIEGLSKLSIERLAYLVCRGGWPGAVKLDERAALQVANAYLEAVINADIHRVDGVEKNPDRVRLMLRSLARNVCTMSTAKTIIDDVVANDITMTEKTYSSYMNALKRIYVVENSPAWQPSLRSKTAIRSSEKRNFVDPSIGIAALHASPDYLLNDFETFGFYFESLCTRDIRVYTQALGGDVYHYRDKNGLEADMVIRLHNGQWAAIEVKMGSRQVDEAAEHLIALRERIDTSKVGEPAFLMVLTGGEYAYKRKDGVLNVPIGCLRE
ncbi:MAG TPA: AAA family ATPase [Bacteroidales bacterium]|nr:AAA family ATPase [Bacteroidales bacterium]